MKPASAARAALTDCQPWLAEAAGSFCLTAGVDLLHPGMSANAHLAQARADTGAHLRALDLEPVHQTCSALHGLPWSCYDFPAGCHMAVEGAEAAGPVRMMQGWAEIGPSPAEAEGAAYSAPDIMLARNQQQQCAGSGSRPAVQ